MRTRWPLWACFGLLAAGCGSSIRMTVPEDFVVLDEESRYEERATSAHGVVLASLDIDNDVEGNLAFWVDAIKNRLRAMGGYALLEERDVTAKTGERGQQLQFGHDEHGATYDYWVTIFTTDDHVFVIEVGGRREHFEEAKARVEQAIASVRLL